MASILCLAHYCDTHGPTPLMSTEGLSVPCLTCRDESMPHLGSQSVRSFDGLSVVSRPLSRKASTSSSTTNNIWTPSHKPLLHSSHQAAAPKSQSSSAIETPPESPRMTAAQHVLPPPLSHAAHRRDSSFRKTYDENDRKRAVPCDNCALTLPKQVKQQIPEGAPGSPGKNGKADNGSPVLRTRKPFEKVLCNVVEDFVSAAASAAAAARTTPSDSDDSETAVPGSDSDHHHHHHRRQQQRRRRHSRTFLRQDTSGSSAGSSSSQHSEASRSGGGGGSHAHFIDYTSTHDPLSPSSFSILRQSCLRTLSCETLPPSTSHNSSTNNINSTNAGAGAGTGATHTTTTPTSPLHSTNPFSTTSSSSLFSHGSSHAPQPPSTSPPSSSFPSASPYSSSPFSTAHTIPATHATGTGTGTTSGGPIFFGDPLAGYTTAYIFRIPDPHARGRRRLYALMALSTQRERSAMRAFSFLAAAFRDIAGWIQALAEQEAERAAAADAAAAADCAANPASAGGGRGGPLLSYPSTARSPPPAAAAAAATDGRARGAGAGAGAGAGTATGGRRLEYTPTSSFLTGRTLDPDGFPRVIGGLGGGGSSNGGGLGAGGTGNGNGGGGGSMMRSRGLAELVGRADFFIELHARFVAILAQLSVIFAS